MKNEKLYEFFAWLRKTILPLIAGLAITIVALNNAELLGELIPASVVTTMLPVCNWIAKFWKKQLEDGQSGHALPETDYTIGAIQESNVGDISDDSKASYLPETEEK